jgi:hypothetical protein
MTVTQPTVQSYEETVQTLSEASVHQHFDAFTDIAWDDPSYAVDATDPRWILPDAVPIGRTDWYKSLPREQQIRTGLYVQANIAKVGLQFEQLLIGGLMQHLFVMPNGRPEFRYSTHEATEECHHTQMFQEFVNRSGIDVPGGPAWFKTIAPIVPLFGRWTPFFFFVMVLGGEEPIDYLQKQVLRGGDAVHPLIQRIMQIHVAEEARHIGFAHHYLEHQAADLTKVRVGDLMTHDPVVLRPDDSVAVAIHKMAVGGFRHIPLVNDGDGC